MNLEQAYRKIWDGKLESIQPPHLQSIERVNQTADLWREHFRDGRLKGPLLDVGCGSGAMLAQAKGAGIEAMGVDFDGPLLSWLKDQGYLVEHADLNEDKLVKTASRWLGPRAVRGPDDRFQIVTSCDVIEHLIDPDHMLAEIYEVLAPGGHAYISTPNCAFWKRVQQLAGGEMFRTSGDQVLRDGGHLAYFGPADLEAAMVRAGFRAVQIHYRNYAAAPGKWNIGIWSNYHYMIAVGEKH